MDAAWNRKENSLEARMRRTDDAIAFSEKRMKKTEQLIQQTEKRVARLFERLKLK